jgi:hypothetical protein
MDPNLYGAQEAEYAYAAQDQFAQLPPEQKSKILSMLLGAGIGAGAGYLGSKYFDTNPLYSTLGGAGVGALGGYLI